MKVIATKRKKDQWKGKTNWEVNTGWQDNTPQKYTWKEGYRYRQGDSENNIRKWKKQKRKGKVGNLKKKEKKNGNGKKWYVHSVGKWW